MKVCILIQAGEGETQAVFVGKDKKGLIQVVLLNMEEDSRTFSSEKAKTFSGARYAALVQMLSNHDDWSVGRYVLQGVAPEWEEWTLVIKNI